MIRIFFTWLTLLRRPFQFHWPLTIDLRGLRYLFGTLFVRRRWYRCLDCGCWCHTDIGRGCYWAEDGKIAGKCGLDSPPPALDFPPCPAYKDVDGSHKSVGRQLDRPRPARPTLGMRPRPTLRAFFRLGPGSPG